MGMASPHELRTDNAQDKPHKMQDKPGLGNMRREDAWWCFKIAK
jgi:hypothetical protein